MKTIFFKLFGSFLICSIILIISMASIMSPSFLQNAFSYQKNSERMTEQQIVTQLEQLDNTYVYDEQHQMKQLLHVIEAYYSAQPSTSLDALTQFVQYDYTFFIVNEQNIIIHATDDTLIGNVYTQPLTELSTAIRTTDKRYTFVMQTKGYEKAYLQTIVTTTLKHNTVLRDLVIWNIHDEQTSRLFTENNILSKPFTRTLQDQRPHLLTIEQKEGYVEKHQFIPYKLGDETSAVERMIYLKFDNKEPLSILQKNQQQIQIMMLMSFIIGLVVTALILKLLYKTIFLAKHDSLTRILNRASYDEMMQKLFQKKCTQPVGLMLVDLDNFKQLNDAFGHAVGDEALKELTSLLKQLTTRSRYAFRFGGDEFALVFQQTNEKELAAAAQQLLHAVEQLQQQRTHWQKLSISIGAALQSEQLPNERALFDQADSALYASKRQGKACYTFL